MQPAANAAKDFRFKKMVVFGFNCELYLVFVLLLIYILVCRWMITKYKESIPLMRRACNFVPSTQCVFGRQRF
ncbi:hypothetical protein L6452_42746 [Arctium lappa]|uniref:Uncharacterized protein n=1 Tax=Arctium lappa TaxID=4217 RepID=A0ACB8XJC4_ARCLA|nr:hypothetical protein L6452_42746 [Arctium lappa]